MANEYWNIRGCVSIARLDAAGEPLELVELHNNSAEWETASEQLTHTNTCDEIAVTDLMVTSSIKPTLKLTIDSATKEALEYIVGGNATDKATPASFLAANTVFPTVAVGKTYPIPNNWTNLETLAITDSTGSPVTLTLGTHYTADLVKGTITILSLTSITQPLKAAGAESATDFNVFSLGEFGGFEAFIRLAGKNIADDNRKVITDVYRCFIPPTKINFKNEGNETDKFELNCMPLKGNARQVALGYGPYAKMVYA
jgi:hypothetical protein